MSQHEQTSDEPGRKALATVVLHVGGLNWASEKAVAEAVLGRRPGVVGVAANPVAQRAGRSTATSS